MEYILPRMLSMFPTCTQPHIGMHGRSWGKQSFIAAATLLKALSG